MESAEKDAARQNEYCKLIQAYCSRLSFKLTGLYKLIGLFKLMGFLLCPLLDSAAAYSWFFLSFPLLCTSTQPSSSTGARATWQSRPSTPR